MIRNLLLFCLISTLCLALTFWALPGDWIQSSLVDYGYAWILCTVIAGALAVWRCRWLIREFLQTCPRGIWVRAAALNAMFLGLTAIHEHLQPKVYADEVLLMNTAQNMHLNRDTRVIFSAYNINQSYTPIKMGVDKRPFLFPFTISVLHDFTGYRISNAFIVNFCATFLLGMCLVLIACHWVPPNFALLILPCLYAPPIFHASVASVGFDVFNLLFIALFIASSLLFVRRPAGNTLLLMLCMAALLANVRYESILYAFSIPFVIFIGWRRNPHVLEIKWLPLVPLLFLLPLFLLQRHFSIPDYWQMQFNNVDKPLSLDFVVPNLQQAIYYFFNLESYIRNSMLVALIGSCSAVVATVSLVSRIKRNRSLAPVQWVGIIYFITALGHFSFLMLYHYGRFTNQIVERLSLPIYLAFALAPFLAIALADIKLIRLIRWPLLPVFVSMGLVLILIPRLAEGRTNLESIHSRDMQWAFKTIRQNYDPQRVMVITNPGPVAIMYQITSTLPELFNANPQLSYFFKDCGLVDEILVVETLAKDPYSERSNHQIGEPIHEDFIFEVAHAARLNSNLYTRILRITGVRGYDEFLKEHKDGKPRLPHEISRQFIDELP